MNKKYMNSLPNIPMLLLLTFVYYYLFMFTLLRKLRSSTMEDLWNKLGELCDVFLQEECKNYFKYVGYGKQMSRPIPNTL